MIFLQKKRARTDVALNMSKNNARSVISLFVAILICSANFHSRYTHAAQLMTPISYQSWIDNLSSYKPNIVVVDMWAMWCSTCLERFPEMVNLHNKYKDQDVTFISMNLDDRNDTESLEAAEKFLLKMDADFEHFRMDENLITAFEKINLISIPAVLIFNQSGDEEFRLTGDNPNKQFSEHDIELAIKELLSQ